MTNGMANGRMDLVSVLELVPAVVAISPVVVTVALAVWYWSAMAIRQVQRVVGMVARLAEVTK